MSSFIGTEVALTGDLFNSPVAIHEMRQAVKQNMVHISETLVGELKRASPKGATNNLEKSWTYAYDDATLSSTISSGVEYAPATELGRKAKGVPREPLELWVRRVLGVTEEKTKRVDGKPVLGYRAIAFLISRKKAKTATPGQFFAKKAFEATVPSLSQAFLGPTGALIVRRLES